MKKFKFSLESVLEVRGLHKTLAERQLAATQSRINHNEEDLQQNRDAYNETFHTLSRPDINHAFLGELTRNYQQSLLHKREQLESERQRLNERLEGEKKALTRRMREEKVLEKLKEQKQVEHLRLADQERQNEIEEIYLLRRGNPQ